MMSNLSFCCFMYHYYGAAYTVTDPKSTLFISIAQHLILQRSNCNKLYIGETSHRLGDCIRDHLYDICKNDLSVSHYFNSSNHFISNFLPFLLSMTVTIVARLKKCDCFTLWALLIPTG